MMARHATRPGVSRRDTAKKARGKQPHYAEPLKRREIVKEARPTTLEPLIDLAYWSNFVEVRRDTASALAQLSQNTDNLHYLGSSGALGALLALIGDGIPNERSDAECIIQATKALAQLVQLDDINQRFLTAPQGLETLVSMSIHGSKSVKKQACAVLLSLAQREIGAEALVDRGGLNAFFFILQSNEKHDIKQAAVAIISILSLRITKKEKLSTSQAVIFSSLDVVAQEYSDKDQEIESGVLDFLTAAASPHYAKLKNNITKTENDIDTAWSLTKPRRRLVIAGTSNTLLHKIKTQHLQLETLSQILRCLLALTANPENRKEMLDQELLVVFSSIVFIKLPQRFGLNSLSELGTLSDASTKHDAREHKQNTTKIHWEVIVQRKASGLQALSTAFSDIKSPPQIMIRSTIDLVAQLTSDDSALCSEAVIGSGILLHIFPTAIITLPKDKSINRAIAKTIQQLAKSLHFGTIEHPQAYVQALYDQGLTAVVDHHLLADDAIQKHISVRTMELLLTSDSNSHYMLAFDSKGIHVLLGKAECLREIVALAFLPQVRATVVNLLALAVELHPKSAPKILLALGTVDVALAVLRDSWAYPEKYAHNIMLTLDTLIPIADNTTQNRLAISPAMSIISHIARDLTKHPGHATAKRIVDILLHEMMAKVLQNALKKIFVKVKCDFSLKTVLSKRKEAKFASLAKAPPPSTVNQDSPDQYQGEDQDAAKAGSRDTVVGVQGDKRPPSLQLS